MFCQYCWQLFSQAFLPDYIHFTGKLFLQQKYKEEKMKKMIKQFFKNCRTEFEAEYYRNLY